MPALIDGGDCVDCLLKQAFGTDCSDPDDGVSGLPRILISEGRAVLQFRRRDPADGFDYSVEISPDGQTWQVLGTAPTPSADQSGLPAGVTRVEVAVPLGSSPADARACEQELAFGVAWAFQPGHERAGKPIPRCACHPYRA